MPETLDVSLLPREAMHGDRNMASVVLALRTTFDDWVKDGLVKPHQSFGFAAAHPYYTHVNYDWDDPYAFVWFVTGWGDDRDRYVANAVRKLRATLRTGFDTLDMRLREVTWSQTSLFRDIVDTKEPDGAFKWGDFPWGGATLVRVGSLIIPSSVSCLRETEDDVAAKTAGGHIGVKMLKLDHPDEFDA